MYCYPIKGMTTPQNLERSLAAIKSHSPMSKKKKTALIYHSMIKYFSFGRRNIVCINTHNSLHQSSAGIGKRLNTHKASDINATNIKNWSILSLSVRSTNILIAHIGQEKFCTDSFNHFLLKVTMLLPNFPNTSKLRRACVIISSNATHAAWVRGNCIDTSRRDGMSIATHKTHVSSGQTIVVVVGWLLCVYHTSNDCQTFCCKTSVNVTEFTGVESMRVIISQDTNHALLARDHDATSSIVTSFVGVYSHSFASFCTVGIR